MWEERITLENGINVALVRRHSVDLLPVKRYLEFGSTNPPIIRRVVVLPQPEGPRKVTNSSS